MSSYRYPNESLIFGVTILLVIGVIVFTSAATFCLSGVFILLMFGMAYWMNRSHHQQLMQHTTLVTAESAGPADRLIRSIQVRIQPGPVEVYISPERQLNAYTFGISSPKAIVLYAPLFQIMDQEELAFAIGHEMGHIQLGHTWLNTVLGGMAGIPASFGAAVLLTVAFKWWNRACEFSADRAGILASGNPEKGISALLKLVSGERHLDQHEMAQLIHILDKEDESMNGLLSELLSDHPMIIKRINQIRQFAASREYSYLLNEMNRRAENRSKYG